jgi:hypothetical protein
MRTSLKPPAEASNDARRQDAENRDRERRVTEWRQTQARRVALVLSDSDEAKMWRDIYVRRRTLTDERAAMMIGSALLNGVYVVIRQFMGNVFRDIGRSSHWLMLERALFETLEPDYAGIRDYLINECECHPTLACRVALRLRPVEHLRSF